jgi:hypothetical protein
LLVPIGPDDPLIDVTDLASLSDRFPVTRSSCFSSP